ncbi:hypothetical protein GGER_21730 [Serratia rubidaea]
MDAALERAVSFGRETFRPSALLLSGGMDSNLLNTYLEPDYPKFHLALEQDAEPMLPQRNLQRVPLRQTDFMAVLRRAVANFGSATRMSSLVMYQQLADAIGDAGYHCVLLGEGADELFWGYPRHVALWRQGRRQRRVNSAAPGSAIMPPRPSCWRRTWGARWSHGLTRWGTVRCKGAAKRPSTASTGVIRWSRCCGAPITC